MVEVTALASQSAVVTMADWRDAPEDDKEATIFGPEVDVVESNVGCAGCWTIRCLDVLRGHALRARDEDERKAVLWRRSAVSHTTPACLPLSYSPS